MQHDTLVVVFGVLTTVLALGYGVPQWLKVRRTGIGRGRLGPEHQLRPRLGRSPGSLYGLWLQDIWVVLTSGAAIPGLTAALVALLRSHASRDGLWMTWAWIATIAGRRRGRPRQRRTDHPRARRARSSGTSRPRPGRRGAAPTCPGCRAAPGSCCSSSRASAPCTALLADVPAYLVYAAIAAVGSTLVLVRLAWRSGPGVRHLPAAARVHAARCSSASDARPTGRQSPHESVFPLRDAVTRGMLRLTPEATRTGDHHGVQLSPARRRDPRRPAHRLRPRPCGRARRQARPDRRPHRSHDHLRRARRRDPDAGRRPGRARLRPGRVPGDHVAEHPRVRRRSSTASRWPAASSRRSTRRTRTTRSTSSCSTRRRPSSSRSRCSSRWPRRAPRAPASRRSSSSARPRARRR